MRVENILIRSSNYFTIVRSCIYSFLLKGNWPKPIAGKKGVYYMATKAKVPIVVGYMDYTKKEIGIKGIVEVIESFNDTMLKISDMYKDVKGKNPENFALDKRLSK